MPRKPLIYKGLRAFSLLCDFFFVYIKQHKITQNNTKMQVICKSKKFFKKVEKSIDKPRNAWYNEHIKGRKTPRFERIDRSVQR